MPRLSLDKAAPQTVLYPLLQDMAVQYNGQHLAVVVADTLERATEAAVAVRGRYDEAASEMQAVLAERPDHAEARHQLGLVYGFIGLFDESLAELEAAVRLDPTATLTRNDLALTYTMLGHYDQAKEEFARVLDQDRENDIARRNLNYLQ